MVIVFDLDDTLSKEILFLQSAYREIAQRLGLPQAYDTMLEAYHNGENAFKKVIGAYGLTCTVDALLNIYRMHVPHIQLTTDARQTLETLQGRATLGIISDGRSLQQRHKIHALGLPAYFEDKNIIISEEFGHQKPDPAAYLHFMDAYPKEEYIYVGDNTKKDFLAPNRLGWDTVCLLDDGTNIHPQDFSLDTPFLPKRCITHLSKLCG